MFTGFMGVYFQRPEGLQQFNTLPQVQKNTSNPYYTRYLGSITDRIVHCRAAKDLMNHDLYVKECQEMTDNPLYKKIVEILEWLKSKGIASSSAAINTGDCHISIYDSQYWKNDIFAVWDEEKLHPESMHRHHIAGTYECGEISHCEHKNHVTVQGQKHTRGYTPLP